MQKAAHEDANIIFGAVLNEEDGRCCEDHRDRHGFSLAGEGLQHGAEPRIIRHEPLPPAVGSLEPPPLIMAPVEPAPAEPEAECQVEQPVHEAAAYQPPPVYEPPATRLHAAALAYPETLTEIAQNYVPQMQGSPEDLDVPAFMRRRVQ